MLRIIRNSQLHIIMKRKTLGIEHGEAKRF